MRIKKSVREEIREPKKNDKEVDLMMNKAVTAVFLSLVFASFAYGDDVIKAFSFQTLDGKSIEYRAASGTPMVITIGSHW